jgi:hypothetical protein
MNKMRNDNYKKKRRMFSLPMIQAESVNLQNVQATQKRLRGTIMEVQEEGIQSTLRGTREMMRQKRLTWRPRQM